MAALTQQQELLIARYLREVEANLSELPEERRMAALERLQGHIHQAFNQNSGRVLDEHGVREVLGRIGEPSAAAEGLRSIEPEASCGLASRQRQWLGVCTELAHRLGIAPRRVRVFAVLAGLLGPVLCLASLANVLIGYAWAVAENPSHLPPWPGLPGLALMAGLGGPVALMAYWAVYMEMYLTAHAGSNEIPRIAKWELAKRLLMGACSVLALYGGTRGVIEGMMYGYMRWTDHTRPVLGSWGWLEPNMVALLFGVMICIIPVAAMSGLPVTPGWKRTMGRLAQACIAGYALVLSAGLASTLTGLILLFVNQAKS